MAKAGLYTLGFPILLAVLIVGAGFDRPSPLPTLIS